MRFDFVILLSLSYFFAAAQDKNEVEAGSLPKCSTNKVACGATIFAYPLLEEQEDFDSSGFGSGFNYDEVLTHETRDLSATPTLSNFNICSCSDDQTCDFESDENSAKIDDHVTLRFCNLSSISTGCGSKSKSPSQVRVIGSAQQTGDSVVSVLNAVMFCNCQSGFKRASVENWGGSNISLNYKCS